MEDKDEAEGGKEDGDAKDGDHGGGEQRPSKHRDGEGDGEEERRQDADGALAADGQICLIPVGTKVLLREVPAWETRGGLKPSGLVQPQELHGRTVRSLLLGLTSLCCRG